MKIDLLRFAALIIIFALTMVTILLWTPFSTTLTLYILSLAYLILLIPDLRYFLGRHKDSDYVAGYLRFVRNSYRYIATGLFPFIVGLVWINYYATSDIDLETKVKECIIATHPNGPQFQLGLIKSFNFSYRSKNDKSTLVLYYNIKVDSDTKTLKVERRDAELKCTTI